MSDHAHDGKVELVVLSSHLHDSSSASVVATSLPSGPSSLEAAHRTARGTSSPAALYALPRRVHGFMRPFHSQQMLVWLAILVSLVAFLAVVLPFLPRPQVDTELWVYLAVYLALLSITLPLYARTETIDPVLTCAESDANAVAANASSTLSRLGGGAAAAAAAAVATGGLVGHARMCEKCAMWMGPRTKHCHICRKCISGFDHHCLFLNTCIGARNYPHFIAMLTFTSLLLAFQLGVTLSVLIRVGRDDAAFLRQIAESSLSRNGYIVLLVLLSSIPWLFLVFVFSLLAFHVGIIIMGQTTYEWILAARARKDAADDLRQVSDRASRADEIERSKATIEAEWREAREADRRKRARTSSRGAAASVGRSPTPVRLNVQPVARALVPEPAPSPASTASVRLVLSETVSASAVTSSSPSDSISPPSVAQTSAEVALTVYRTGTTDDFEVELAPSPSSEIPSAIASPSRGEHALPTHAHTSSDGSVGIRLASPSVAALALDESVARESVNPLLLRLLPHAAAAADAASSPGHVAGAAAIGMQPQGTLLPLPPHLTDYSASAPPPQQMRRPSRSALTQADEREHADDDQHAHGPP